MSILVAFAAFDGTASRTETSAGSWQHLRDSAGTGTNTTSASGLFVEFATDSGGAYVGLRGFFTFDTSSITVPFTVSAADLSVIGTAKSTQAGLATAAAINVFANSQAAPTTLANSDYQNCGTTRYSTDITNSGYSTSGVNDFTLNGTGLAAISGNSYTQMCLREATHDADNHVTVFSSVNGGASFSGKYSETAGTSSDPTLTITYANPIIYNESMSDSMTLSDSLAVKRKYKPSLSGDSLTLSASLVALYKAKPSLSDSMSLSDSLAVIAKYIVPLRDIVSGTLTLYPQLDGYIQASNIGWAATRASASGTVISSTLLKLIVDDSGFLGRAILVFDTSPLTSLAIGGTATLSIYGQVKDNGYSSPGMNVYGATPASDSSLTGTDFQQVGSTAFSTSISNVAFNTAGYNDFSFNASGLAAINKTTPSRFALREPFYDVANIDPGSPADGDPEDNVTGYSSRQTGTSKDPVLVINYTAYANMLLSDALAAIAKDKPSLTDSLALSATLSVLEKMGVALTDSLTLADVVSVVMKARPGLLDSIGLSDTLTTIDKAQPHLTDSLASSDSLANTVKFRPQLADSQSSFDALSIGSKGILTLSDNTSLSDALSVIDKAHPHLVDSLASSDALTAQVKFEPQLANSQNISDTLTIANKGVVPLTDSMLLNDALLIVHKALPQISSLMSLVDSLSVTHLSEPQLFDALDLFDSLAIQKLSLLNLDDIIILTDALDIIFKRGGQSVFIKNVHLLKGAGSISVLLLESPSISLVVELEHSKVTSVSLITGASVRDMIKLKGPSTV